MKIHANLGQFRFSPRPFYLYRSSTNGCTNLLANIEPRKFVYTSKYEKLSSSTKVSAIEFFNWTKQRSIQPILFQVPAPGLDPSQVSSLANFLGTPFIKSPEGQYSSYDNSHLTPDSAKIFTENLLWEFEKFAQ